MFDDLPPPIDAEPKLQPVPPPEGSPDYARRHGAQVEPAEAGQSVAKEPPQSQHVATLAFTGTRGTTIPLAFPFSLDGNEITQIEVQRLSIAQIDQLVASKLHGDLDEIVAAMTSLPAAVLRGLDAEDGQTLRAVAYDFLPRFLREAFRSS